MNVSFEERFGRFHALLIFGLGFLIRIWLIRTYPPIYGGDTVIHLRNYEHIFLGHQLPALQVLIFVTYKLTSLPFAFRCVMALIGSASGVGFYFLAKSLTDQQTALWAVLFFVTNPFLNEISIVPFQEILMLGALCFATYFYIEKRIAAASLVLALACLTRYEAWIACPFFALDYLLQNRKTFMTAVTAVGLFCWAPLAWIGWHLGLAGAGSYVIEIPQSADRFVRWFYLGWIIAKNTPLPVLFFSLLGLYFIWSRRLVREKCIKIGTAFAFLFGIAVLCSAHGDDHAGVTSAERFVSSREAAIPMGAVLLLGGMGAAFLLRKQRWSLPIACLISTAILLGVFQSSHFVRAEVSPPDIHLSYELAQFADAHLQSGERMLISARPFSSAEFRPYLEKTRQASGERGYKRALENLQKEDLSPIDFQRTAVQSRRTDRLSATGSPNDFDWIAVWSDSAPSADFTGQLRGLRPVDFLHKGPLLIEIYHRLGTKK
jgi:Dolichyl-phosphate-mannose-protein mannosyltransferase